MSFLNKCNEDIPVNSTWTPLNNQITNEKVKIIFLLLVIWKTKTTFISMGN